MALSKAEAGDSKAILDLDRRLKLLERFPPLRGTIIDVEIGSDFVRVPHGLGRPYVGFVSLGGCHLVDDKTVNKPERELWLRQAAPWTLLEHKVVAVDTGSVVFSNLKGDEDKVYVLDACIENNSGATQNTFLRFNSSATNYDTIETTADGATVATAALTTGMWIHGSSGGGFSTTKIVAKTGQQRFTTTMSVRNGNGVSRFFTGNWSDTTTEVTSLQVYNAATEIGAGSQFWLYALHNRPTTTKVWVF